MYETILFEQKKVLSKKWLFVEYTTEIMLHVLEMQ